MDEQHREEKPAESLLESWMRAATAFWGTALRMWPEAIDATSMSSLQGPRAKSRLHEWWESSFKAFQAMSAAMSEPESVEGFFRGINTFPDIVSRLMKPAWGAFFHLQQEWMERAGRIGKSTGAYTFENLDQEAFKAWIDVYEKEFRQFLRVPQLGLTRFYQERLNEVVDKFNIFQAAVSEFISVLYLPLEKSFPVMQERLTELADGGKFPQKFKDYYGLWVKILEGHYMSLFKSPEYSQTVARTLDAMAQFMVARRRILEDTMQCLPVPTQRDMDELYKEIYTLKKRIRELEKNNRGEHAQ